MIQRAARIQLGLAVVALSAASPRLAAEVSFERDVMAVFSRAGCNQGTCHGNKNGKGGFKLSLRGELPAVDHVTLTRGLAGRRLNLSEPERSLLLEKPLARVPHEGGRRFSNGSLEHGILREWLESGAPYDPPARPRLVRFDVTPAEEVLFDPDDRVQTRSMAVFSDGSSRDVTGLAVHDLSSPIASVSPDGLIQRTGFGEAVVMVRYLHLQAPVRVAFRPAHVKAGAEGQAPNALRSAQRIDDLVLAKLRKLEIEPSELADDRTFLRRAYLDTVGVLPTAEEAKAFLTASFSDRRERLVDQLLARGEFAHVWAQKWSDLLRNEERTLDAKGVQTFYNWMRRSFDEGKPLDRLVRELLTARGSTYKNPAASYFRAARDPITRAESAAQVFLGLRLQCAKCHGHPFDRWSQDDYYGWAGLFARIDYKVLENRRRDTNDKHEFAGEQVVYTSPKGEVEDPRTGQPAPLRFLGSGLASVADGSDRLAALADWIASPKNPFFARAQVNRIWAHFFGRGIVEPVDDFRSTNPPSNPALLDYLEQELIASGYNLRHMARLILTSRAYQLSSVPNASNELDETNFSRTYVRRLTAEQLLDAQHQAAGVPPSFTGFPEGTRAGQLPGIGVARALGRSPTRGEQFLAAFGKPLRLLPCECERSNETTLGQTFQLLSGPAIQGLLDHPSNRISRLLSAGRSDVEIIDDLYLSALSRAPAKEEIVGALEVLAHGDRRSGLEDILWSLLNAKELLFRS